MQKQSKHEPTQYAGDDGKPVYDVAFLVRANNLADAMSASRLSYLAHRSPKKRKGMQGQTKQALVTPILGGILGAGLGGGRASGRGGRIGEGLLRGGTTGAMTGLGIEAGAGLGGIGGLALAAYLASRRGGYNQLGDNNAAMGMIGAGMLGGAGLGGYTGYKLTQKALGPASYDQKKDKKEEPKEEKEEKKGEAPPPQPNLWGRVGRGIIAPFMSAPQGVRPGSAIPSTPMIPNAMPASPTVKPPTPLPQRPFGNLFNQHLRPRTSSVPAPTAKVASVPSEWYQASPFCAAFIQTCLQRGVKGDKLIDEITKTAADAEVAKEWTTFFEKL